MLVSSQRCSSCGADCPKKGRFCPHCGSALYIICGHCGQKNAKSLTHCSHCKTLLPPRRKKRWEKPTATSGRALERRQLTIMFTDLVDSTGLADSMDPEDFLALIEAHRTIAVAPITRLGGVVARYLGDGMLVLFGYPEAHEDDPERAVRAGLEVARATMEMNQRWVGEGKGRIAVRIGIHTGIVIVGDVLKANVQELMAVFGNTPSIAARLQALAQPNSVMLSGDTKALLPDAVRCDSRGNVTLKGLKRPIEIFAAIEVREGEGDRRPAGRVLPFVNREPELATIRQRWAAARRGEGGCIIIKGEPGIGKSRLIRAVQERIVTQPSRWLVTRTSPYASNTDFFAFSELFRRLLMPDAAVAEPDAGYEALKTTLKNQGLDDADVTVGLARLIGVNIPEDATTIPLQPERARELILAAITVWLQHTSQIQPLVLIIEDLHWADASTLEAIDRLKPILPSYPLLLISTSRGASRSATRSSSTGGLEESSRTVEGISELPDEVGHTPDFKVDQELEADICTVVLLERLRAESASDLLGHVLQGVVLPKESVSTLLERANGVPLYLEELPKPLLEASGQTQTMPVVLPATLRDSLMAQLDYLGEAKTVAQTAAVLGHSFERLLLERVWEGEVRTLDSGLSALTHASLLSPEADANALTFGFRHALLAEIAYESLLRDERRRIHKRTADILAAHFQPLVETRPDILARHHDSAGSHEQAFDCWMKAAVAAAQRSANAEAIGHFRKAEDVLIKLESAGTVALEERWLELYRARAPVLIALFGWSAAELKQTYKRILHLAEGLVGRERYQFDAWAGIYNFHLLRGSMTDVEEAVSRMHGISSKLDDHDLSKRWHRVSALKSFLAARFDEAIHHYEASLKFADSEAEIGQKITRGVSPLVLVYSFKAWAHWFKGQNEAAAGESVLGLAAAGAADHPFSTAYALCLKGSLSQCQGDFSNALVYANNALSLSMEYDFPYWSGWSKVLKGWALAMAGNTKPGIACLKDGIAGYRGTAAAQMHGYNLCLLAEAYKAHSAWREVVQASQSAIAEMERTGITFYLSEAQRLLSEGMFALGEQHIVASRACILALRTAERQQSVPLFVRAFRVLKAQIGRPAILSACEARAEQMIKKMEVDCSPREVLEVRQAVEEIAAR